MGIAHSTRTNAGRGNCNDIDIDIDVGLLSSFSHAVLHDREVGEVRQISWTSDIPFSFRRDFLRKFDFTCDFPPSIYSSLIVPSAVSLLPSLFYHFCHLPSTVSPPSSGTATLLPNLVSPLPSSPLLSSHLTPPTLAYLAPLHRNDDRTIHRSYTEAKGRNQLSPWPTRKQAPQKRSRGLPRRRHPLHCRHG